MRSARPTRCSVRPRTRRSGICSADQSELLVSTNVKPVVEVQQPIQRIKAKPLAPAGNLLMIMNAGLFRDPRSDFLVAHTCGHELFEFSGVYARKVEKR